MRIAVCDDEREYAENVAAMVAEYLKSKCAGRADIEVFTSAHEMLGAVQGGARFDVYLLDILMSGIGGMDAAKILRRGDGAAKIIFLTSSSEYAVESYAVGAYYYLLKPAGRDALSRLFGKILRAAEGSPKRLTIKTQAGYRNVEIGRIEYVEIVGRTLRWALSGGEVAESAGRLADIEAELLKYPEFIKPHRSYIVNMTHIVTLDAGGLKTRSFGPIPISRNLYQQVKDGYIGYSFSDWDDAT